MKHITKHYDEALYSSNIFNFYFKDMKAGVLDIETTGLKPLQNQFILGGMFTFHDKTLHQFLSENKKEEKETLESFLQEISKLDMVITYNGRHFDMPFIAKRSEILGITGKPIYNLDLYLVLNGHSPVKRFVPNLKQKTVENYMGLWQNRTDEISGGESAALYHTYEKTGDTDLEEKILLHNSDDVLQLTRLLQVISKCDFHKAMFSLGFPVGPLYVKKIKFEGDFMTVSGKQLDINLDYMGFSFEDYPVETRFESKSAAFFIKFPLIRDSGLYIVDLDAAGLDRTPFEIYPTYSSGFLALETQKDRNFMEINHFIKTFITSFLNHL